MIPTTSPSHVYNQHFTHALTNSSYTHTIPQATKMTTTEKQKKGYFMNFYKNSSTKNFKPKSESNVVTNKIMWPTSLSRKPKNYYQEAMHGHGNGATRWTERGAGNIVVEARRSVSHVETSLTSVASFLQVQVLVTDMRGFMKVHAFRCARRSYDSLDKVSSKHMAYNINKEFDKVYGPAWHCILGSIFGSFVTHSTGCCLYFSIEELYILAFKTKVQKALD